MARTKGNPKEGRQGWQNPNFKDKDGGAYWGKERRPSSSVHPPSPAQEAPPEAGEIMRIVEAEQLEGVVEVAIIIANLTVGPDGCRGQAIYVGWGGASQEAAPTYCGRQNPQKEFLKTGKVKKTLKYQLGTVALCKFWQLQKSTELLIWKLPFLQLVWQDSPRSGQI